MDDKIIPELSVSNPGGEWLKGKKNSAKKSGLQPSGAYVSLGAETGVFKSEPEKTSMGNRANSVLIPVDKLSKVKGMLDEQSSVRQRSLDYLKNYMDENDRLPRVNENSTRDYHPFLNVDQDGNAFVNEGNHRIMAAKELGFKYLPTQINYFNGGEDIKGDFHPDVLLQDHVKALDKGYSVDSYGPKANPEKISGGSTPRSSMQLPIGGGGTMGDPLSHQLNPMKLYKKGGLVDKPIQGGNKLI